MNGQWTPSWPRPQLAARAAARLGVLTPFLVWLGAIAALCWLSTRLPDAAPLPALADAARTPVLAPAPGRVTELLVRLHAEVAAGQPVARFAAADGSAPVTVLAPRAGRVLTLDAEPGQGLAAGASITTLVDAAAACVHAFVPEHALTFLTVGSRLRVARLDQHELGVGTVASISPALVPLPARLWPDPQHEQFGYELVVTPTGHEHPGERLLLLPVR
ncbi:MAG: HlyD family efflux transporter periplasmic adaptor subunit [Planctomycetes bacterium]|nr:HlyD family efflux transporter periplasmic adaptor subunit [Planctomycetota bacterium]